MPSGAGCGRPRSWATLPEDRPRRTGSTTTCRGTRTCSLPRRLARRRCVSSTNWWPGRESIRTTRRGTEAKLIRLQPCPVRGRDHSNRALFHVFLRYLNQDVTLVHGETDVDQEPYGQQRRQG